MSGLTRSITDRLFVGILSAVFAPLTGIVLYARLTHSGRLPDDWLVQLLFYFMFECITVIFVGSTLGIIWAIWTPDWIERRLRHSVGKFLFMFCAVSVVIATGALLCTLIQKP